MDKNVLYWTIALFIIVRLVNAEEQVDFQTGQHVYTFEGEINRTIRCQYLLYLPKDYTTAKKWPLILYLHGGIGRGDDIEKMKWYPVVKICSNDDSLPFIVLSPQCPAGESWTDHEMLITLLRNVISKHSVDTDRIYLAGYSMGGQGVWFLAYMYPERFAAIAPMSGVGNKFWASKLIHTPIWAFHGEKDNLIPCTETLEMAEAIEAAGGYIKVSIDPTRGHSPPSAREHEALFKWFLEQKRHD